MWWSDNKKPKHLPAACGPYVVGCMDVMVDYSSDGLFTRFYYPTDECKDDPSLSQRWIPWIPHINYIYGFAYILKCFPFIVRLIFWWAGVFIPVVYGSKPKTNEKLKCIIFSHGLGTGRFFYSNICCELASRGYLVVALEHRDSSAASTYYYQSKLDAQTQRQTLIKFRHFKQDKEHHKQRKDQVNYRTHECCKVLDLLLDVNSGTNVPHNVITDEQPSCIDPQWIAFDLNDFVGNLDVNCITMMGHSFGGGTALAAMAMRNEFKQGILLDPWMFPIKDHGLVGKVDQPLLFINTQTFHIESNVKAMSKYLTDGDDDQNHRRQMYTILHTTHESQADTTLFLGHWLNLFMRKLRPITALKINNSIILRFLNEYVGSSPSSIDDCTRYLLEQKDNIARGLTKPWS